jgi:tRNA(Ile)-lysidine synthetase-like protein
MRYIVAVSGGVDSVVLLDMLAKGELFTGNPRLLIAHFDHGIREDSADDAVFVKSLAEKYGLPLETRREELGKGASEEKARDRRYAFLRAVAKKHKAKIMTAHHADDIVETVAINLTRGTGWRGLAVLDSSDIERPLLDKTKAELLKYAQEHNLDWREDATNQDTKYLRNDLRQKLAVLDDQTRSALLKYRTRQVFLRQDVDNETRRLVGASPYERHLFITVPEYIAMELLRSVLVSETGSSPTRPGLMRALHAVKVLHAGKKYDIDTNIMLRFTKTHFVVQTGT